MRLSLRIGFVGVVLVLAAASSGCSVSGKAPDEVQPTASPSASEQSAEAVPASPGKPVSSLGPEAHIHLPDLGLENVLYLDYHDSKGTRYFAPDQYPAVERFLEVLAQAPEVGLVPVEARSRASVGIRLRDDTWVSVAHRAAIKAHVAVKGEAAAIHIPGLDVAFQDLAAVPPGAVLGDPVTGLPEPVVLLRGPEVEEYRPEPDGSPVRELPGLPAFGMGQFGTMSPDGRLIAFTFGISDGTGLWVYDVDAGRYRHLWLLYGTRHLRWLTHDRLIYHADGGIGCAALDAEPPILRRLDLPGEEHPDPVDVAFPWVIYRTGWGDEAVLLKTRIDGPGGC